jgi:hypothetical protein
MKDRTDKATDPMGRNPCDAHGPGWSCSHCTSEDKDRHEWKSIGGEAALVLFQCAKCGAQKHTLSGRPSGVEPGPCSADAPKSWTPAVGERVVVMRGMGDVGTVKTIDPARECPYGIQVPMGLVFFYEAKDLIPFEPLRRRKSNHGVDWYERGWEAGVETCAREVMARLGLDNLAEHLRKTCLPTNPPARERATSALDPDHCAYCRAFVERQRQPGPKIELKNECWEAALLKMKQLERELHSSSCTPAEKADMLHTHSKLCMFATDAWEQEVLRPAQRRERAPKNPQGDGSGGEP